jgi:hypothetical protein
MTSAAHYKQEAEWNLHLARMCPDTERAAHLATEWLVISLVSRGSLKSTPLKLFPRWRKRRWVRQSGTTALQLGQIGTRIEDQRWQGGRCERAAIPPAPSPRLVLVASPTAIQSISQETVKS